MAIESPRIIADVIEVQEFPQLAQKYVVRGVPKTVINDAVEFTGAVSEEEFIRHVMKAAGEESPDDDSEVKVSDKTTPFA